MEVGKFDKNNEKTGLWKTYNDESTLIAIYSYLNGKLNGYWETYNWTNNNIACAGYYMNNIQIGPAIGFFICGRKVRFQGTLFENRYKGLYKNFYSNGKIKVLQFIL